MKKAITQEAVASALSKGNTLVDFWAPWCKPCVAIGKELDRLKTLKPDVTIIKVNVDDHQELAREYGIKGIPYVMYSGKAGNAPRAFTGLLSAEEMMKRLQS